MPTLTLPAEGGCRCGHLRFQISLAPVMASVCHCTGCQRMSGSAFSTTAMVPLAGFQVIAGDPVVGGLKGPSVHHMHCPDCMSWVFSTFGPERPIVNIRAVMFDDPSWFTPLAESWVSEKQPWATLPVAHSFAQFPPPETRDSLMQEYARTLEIKDR